MKIITLWGGGVLKRNIVRWGDGITSRQPFMRGSKKGSTALIGGITEIKVKR